MSQRPISAGTPQWFGALGEMYDATTSSGMSPSVVVRFHPSSATTLSTVRACRNCSSCAPRMPGYRNRPAGSRSASCIMRSDVDVGKRVQQNAVDDAEHRARGPDAQRQREHRGDGEAGTATQFPPGIAKIGDDGVHDTGFDE